MIAGRFGEIGELIFEIELIGADGESYPVEVLLDTGFTTGWLAFDTQDVESLGWSSIEPTFRLARAGIPEPLLGLQWLRMLPLAVNFPAGVLTLG
jgi:predicted aspartyl protease